MKNFVGCEFVNPNETAELYSVIGKRESGDYLVDVFAWNEDCGTYADYKSRILLTENELKRMCK